MTSAAPLESVPNISVGRNVALVDELVDVTRAGALRGAERDGSRAAVVDVHRDEDHDRSVLTIIGTGAALEEALAELARATIERVDIHAGHGVHPRVGVLDVLPIIALGGHDAASVDGHRAAVALVARLASRIGALGVPVVRYGLDDDGCAIEGAEFAGRARRGGPGAVRDRIAAGELMLAAGPATPHATAGVTLAGVRDVLIAFNVDLAADDVDAARAIAARIRASAAGPDALPGIRALGLRLSSRGVVQVSTNVELFRTCGPERVLRTVARLAQELGVEVAAAELVGLTPDSALGPLRYGCVSLGVPLLACAEPSLDRAVGSVL